MNILKKFRYGLMLRMAAIKADNLHSQNGHRYYVIPFHDGPKRKPRLMVIDRQNFRQMRAKHYFNNQAKVLNLLAESVYYTADRSGRGSLTKHQRSAKAGQFFAWLEHSKA